MAKRKPLVAAPRQRSLVWLQGLLCGAMATLATPTALLLAVLLGPAFAAIGLDRDPGRPRARAIALCSMAAVVEPLQILWTTGHTMATATALLESPRVIALAWSAAAAGWLLAELSPIVAKAVLEALSLTRAARLRADRARLAEAWGLEASSDGQ
jgi:hypothetical protein